MKNIEIQLHTKKKKESLKETKEDFFASKIGDGTRIIRWPCFTAGCRNWFAKELPLRSLSVEREKVSYVGPPYVLMQCGMFSSYPFCTMFLKIFVFIFILLGLILNASF